MTGLAVLALSAFIVACAEGLTAFDYHRRIGIPGAERIQQLEEQELSRIVGGSTAASGANPYQAGLVITLTSDATSVCGGSLLTNTRTVTAAHCWNDGWNQARQLVVVFGSLTLFTGGTRITTSDVAMHGSWNPNTVANDVAMITHSSVTYTNLIQPIALPSGTELNEDFAGVWAVASGWGARSDTESIASNQVNYEVNLQVITNVACQQFLGSTVTASNICTSGAGGVGTCDGDSGGPLAVVSGNSRILVGITSFGSPDGCTNGEPTAFARGTSFAAWMQARM